jgi:hypothetical protein
MSSKPVGNLLFRANSPAAKSLVLPPKLPGLKSSSHDFKIPTKKVLQHLRHELSLFHNNSAAPSAWVESDLDLFMNNPATYGSGWAIPRQSHVPEAYQLLISEMQALCLDVLNFKL